MSVFRVPVVRYSSEPHPNADKLELGVVEGWRSACKLGAHKPGDKVAYIPEASVLPDDLIEEMGLSGLLAGAKRNRVKAIRLRGVLSQGLIYGGERIQHLDFGDDAAQALQIDKYEPPVPVHMSGLMYSGPTVNYDIDNIKSWPDRLSQEEPLAITEKLHGTFCCLGVQETSYGVFEPVVSSKGQLSKGLRFKVDAPENEHNLYVKAWHRHKDAIRAIARESKIKENWRSSYPRTVYVFGEIIGRKVQDLDYGYAQPVFRVFDIRLSSSGYVNWFDMTNLAGHNGLLSVPLLHVGLWAPRVLTDLVEGNSTLADHPREGIVAKPLIDRYDTGADHESGRGPGRIIFKIINESHLLREGATEHN